MSRQSLFIKIIGLIFSGVKNMVIFPKRADSNIFVLNVDIVFRSMFKLCKL